MEVFGRKFGKTYSEKSILFFKLFGKIDFQIHKNLKNRLVFKKNRFSFCRGGYTPYCKHVLMYEIVLRLVMPGFPYSCFIQVPVTNFPIMPSACNCSNSLSFIKYFCNADHKLVVLRHELSK